MRALRIGVVVLSAAAALSFLVDWRRTRRQRQAVAAALMGASAVGWFVLLLLAW